MARVERGRHKRIAVTADDGSSDIQTQRDWNGDSHEQLGVLGFDPVIVTLSTGVASPTNSDTMLVIASESGTEDDFVTLTATDYQVHDVVELKADTGDTITVKHGTGNINLRNDIDISLREERPLILRYDGTNWEEVVSTNFIFIGGVPTEVFDY